MKIQVSGAICAVLLCLATAGYAQKETNQSGTMITGTSVSGSIVSVSNDVIVVRTEAGETMRFNRDASVNVPSNLAVGNRVSVEYNLIATDNMRLTRIALDNTTSGSSTYGNSATGSNTTGSNLTGNNTTGNSTNSNGTYNNSTTGTTTSGYSSLPRTASPLVMLAFAGLASLGGALALRARRRS